MEIVTITLTFAAMRFISFILAFTILALSCLPCADEPDAIKEGREKSELVKTPARSNDQEHNDDCSPFCHCTCCSGFSINHIFASVTIINLLQVRNFVSYLPVTAIEISLPVWQPPQLVS